MCLEIHDLLITIIFVIRIWIGNALIHSIILYWMPMYSYFDGAVWGNGRDGGYLVLGNMVYTVRSLSSIPSVARSSNDVLITVCCRNSLLEGRLNLKFVDMADSLCYLGFNCIVVPLYANLQVN
jgi:hypothetical protein